MVLHRPAPKWLAITLVAGLALGLLSPFCPASALAQASSRGSKPGQLSCQPGNFRFHQVPLGQNKILPARLTNTGTASVTVTALNNHAPGFTVNRLTIPFTLTAGQSLNFDVTFTPAKVGQVSGNLEFISNASNNPYPVFVYGNGTAAGVLAANPVSIDFGAVQVGKEQSRYETLSNTGSSSLTVTQAAVTGNGFRTSGLTLPLGLNPGDNFTFTVLFAPLSSGPASGNIALVSDALNPNLSIPLSGVGTAAGQLGVNPGALDFGVVAVGTNKTLPATLGANGANVTVTSALVSGSEFSLAGISLPLTIPAGQSQPFSVTYTPAGSGPAAGSISFGSDASNSPTIQYLSGSGAAPPRHTVDLSWSASPSQVAGYNLYRGDVPGGPYQHINPMLEVGTSFVDDTVTAGHTYYYVATAVDDAGHESVHSNETQAVVPLP